MLFGNLGRLLLGCFALFVLRCQLISQSLDLLVDAVLGHLQLPDASFEFALFRPGRFLLGLTGLLGFFEFL